MRNKLIISSIIFIAALISLNFSSVAENSGKISLNDITLMANADSEGGQNQATCYSTYKTPIIGGTWIWVCGSCVQARASEYSDPGICYF